MSGFSPIKKPTGPAGVISAGQVLYGPPILPIKRIRLYSADEWEEFTTEWVDCSLKGYKEIVRFNGAGDRGVDIAAFTNHKGFLGVWDGIQCKHYNRTLTPSDAKLEIGKILWYSFNGEYNAPRSYSFFAPCGIGRYETQQFTEERNGSKKRPDQHMGQGVSQGNYRYARNST